MRPVASPIFSLGFNHPDRLTLDFPPSPIGRPEEGFLLSNIVNPEWMIGDHRLIGAI